MLRTLMVLSLVLLAPAAIAEEAKEVTIDLGTDAVMAGQKTSLFVVLATTGAPQVGTLHFEVIFPSNVLNFVKLSNGAGAENSEAKITSEVVKSAASDESILKVDVAAPKPIPQGAMVSLMFEVSHDVPPEGDIKLKAGQVSAAATDGSTLAAKGVDGLLKVLAADSMAFACFFYMH